jgi:nucleoid-associated protein EbfC
MNPFEMLKQFGNIQEKMKETQERLKTVRVTGSAGGDMVQVELNGHMEVLQVRISPEAVDPSDRSLLEDLVRAAVSDALDKVKDRIREEMIAASGGLNLPPGMMGF